MESGSVVRISEKENTGQLDDVFNLAKAVMKKNKIVLDPIQSESFSLRGDTETNRVFISNNTKMN